MYIRYKDAYTHIEGLCFRIFNFVFLIIEILAGYLAKRLRPKSSLYRNTIMGRKEWIKSLASRGGG